MHLKMETKMVLQNNMISLRKLTLRHAKDFFNIFNDPEISKFSTIPFPLKITWVKNYIKKSMEKFDADEKYTWGIFSRFNNQFLGVATLRNIDHENRTARIGYSIGQNYWNRGFTKMAVRLMLNYAFKDQNLNRLEIRIDCQDEKSITLLEDLNGVCEGTLRKAIYRNGIFHDLHLFSILREDYLKEKE
jgi:[ribosomal protein S5]-alanine N-acetyltransferase